MSTPELPSAEPVSPGALPVGTRLGEYELRSVIGVGGFGIVYLAFDHALEREVAIKEYMPATLAARSQSVRVAPLSQSVTESFETGLRSFVNEGRMLAHFDSPSLLKVYRYWEANGTAYITMPLYRGRTLKEVRAAMSAPPDEAAARALLMPLLQAVEQLHRESIYHRDIAPDNILIEAGNLPVLLDFGAARRVFGEANQALTAILKPAYAPIEQYGEAASLKQGAWTDLYALGATLHFYLLGYAPPASTARAVQDEMQPLAERELPGCSKRFLQAIDWMLAPRPADRPHSVAALREVLEGRAEVPQRTQFLGRAAPAAGVSGVDIPIEPPPPPLPPPPPPPPPPSPPPPPPPAPAPAPAAVPSTSAAAPSKRPGRALPAVAGALVVAAATWWLWPRQPQPAPPATPAVVQTPAPAPAPAVAPPPAPVPTAAVRSEPSPPPPAATSVAPSKRTPSESQTAAVAPPKRAEAPRPPPAAASVQRPRPAPPPAPLADARPAEAKASPRAGEPPATVPPATAAQAEPAPAVTAVKGPRETCGRRVFVALLNCMNRECAKPQNRQLPECSLYRPPD